MLEWSVTLAACKALAKASLSRLRGAKAIRYAYENCRRTQRLPRPSRLHRAVDACDPWVPERGLPTN